MEQKITKKHRNDFLLVLGILLIAVIAFAIFKFTLRDANYVVVTVNGEETDRYIISENIETVITTGDEENQFNTLVIQDNKTFIEEANCPDKICSGHRPISKVGETIVCLPHKVVITISE